MITRRALLCWPFIPKEITTTWNLETLWSGGEPAVGVGDSYHHNVGWIPDMELGFRSDGVVVWRKKEKTR